MINKFNPEWLDRAGFELKANYFGLHLSAGYLIAGLAWEYQFETEQNIVIDNLVVTPANFKGHTGLLNLGLGLQGALGQCNGFGGNLNLGFSF